MSRIYASFSLVLCCCSPGVAAGPVSSLPGASHASLSSEPGGSTSAGPQVTSSAIPEVPDPFMSDRTASQRASMCKDWHVWAEPAPYQACYDYDHPVSAFGLQADVALFRDQANRVVGHSLTFGGCTDTVKADLVQAVRKEYGLGSGTDLPYSVEGDGTTYHMKCESNRCTVTVADGDFGKAFVGNLMAQGLSGLFRINH